MPQPGLARSECPPDSVLIELVEGRLTGPTSTWIEQHVAGCSACQARGEALRRGAPAAGERGGGASHVGARAPSEGEAPPTSERAAHGREALGLAPGTLFQGRYQIVRRIKAGGMGAVYEVVHVETRRRRALKVMLPWIVADATMRARFQVETTIAADIKSEHIVETFDAGIDPQTGAPFLVMELLEGEELADLVKARGPRPAAEVVTLLGQAALALDRTHAAGIVHRDLKPQNLFLTRRDDGSPRIKILDFGIAKLVTPGDQRTHTQTLGTPLYMPREQIRGEVTVGPASDRHALAHIAYTLLVGTPYWAEEMRTAGSAFSLMVLISEGIQEPATTRAARVGVTLPPAFDAWFARATALDPAARHPSSSQMIAALAEALGVPPPPRAREDGAGLVDLTGAPTAQPADPGCDPGATTVPAPTMTGSPAPLVQEPPARRRRAPVLAVAVLVALLGAAATAWILAASSRAPVTRPAAAAAQRCADNRACAAGGKAAVCRREDGVCVALASEDCRVLAAPGDVENDATIWVGAMFPTSGADPPLYGAPSVRAVDLARRDFAEIAGGLPPARPGGPRRPIAVVACDDRADPARAARHLVEDVRVPAIVGFALSAEVSDLATSVFLPRGVLALASNTASMLRTIPHPPGAPRLVWRTTTSADMTVAPTIAFVAEVMEPAIRSTPSEIRPGEPIRLALLRLGNASGASFASLYTSALRFNGKTALENGDALRQIVVPDNHAAHADDATRDRVAAEIVAFAPHLVIDAGGSDGSLVRAIERAWPRSVVWRPRYVLSELSDANFGALLQEHPGAHRRFFGVDTLIATPAINLLVLRYNEVFTPKTTPETVVSAPYDAFYLLAYAAAALGAEPVTGTALARAIPRLIPPGEPIDVGPGGIFTALHALESGKNIDLAGTTTSLDFDLETGDATADFSVHCMTPAGRVIESGMIFDARTRKLQGKLRCP